MSPHDMEVTAAAVGGRRAGAARTIRPAFAPAAAPLAARELVLERPISIEPPADSRSALPRARSEALSRALNMALAATALVLLSPVLLLTAIAIALTSRGPVLYVQPRVGLDRRRRSARPTMYDRRIRDLGGRVFGLYKFRSMYVDAESRTGAVWATRNDPRVTPVGRLIRKCRIDEFPQLINVIKGDMNIVGPRPERPSIFATLRERIEEYPLRQRARPGITGWAQINQSYDSCLDDVRGKVRYDLEYLARQSMVEDVRIMVRTLPVMIFSRGGW